MVIYLAINKVNGKMYVGLTSKSLEVRKSLHMSSSKNPDKNTFHCAIRKYGKENFEWLVLEECGDLETLNFREQCYIAELGTLAPYGYNISCGGSYVPTKVEQRKFSIEHINKLSFSHSGNRNSMYGRGGDKNPMYGRSQSIGAREINRLAHSGENNASAKLSWDLVRTLRGEYSGKPGEQKFLSLKYGVERTLVNRILNNKRWQEN
jgi:group I intron endonuclease